MAYVNTSELPSLCSENQELAVHFNARSIRKHFDEFQCLLSTSRHPFAIICISETWLSDADKNLYCFPSYSSEYCHRDTSNHGGAAIFLHSSLKYKRRLDLALNVPDCESVWVEIDKSTFGSLNKNTIFGCIYRSPSSSIQNFCSAFDKVLHLITDENKNVVVLGDININLLDDCSSVNEYSNCYQGHGLETLINIPTRCSDQGTSTLIDHALTNILTPPEAFVIRANITDHYLIALRFHSTRKDKNPPSHHSVFDKNLFAELIRVVDWSRVTSLTDPKNAYAEFYSILKSAIDSSTSIRLNRKNYLSPQNAWVTHSLLNSMRKKENLYRKIKRQPFNAVLKQRYKKYSNTLTLLLKTAKRQYLEKQISDAGNDVSKQWRILNTFLNNTAPKNEINEIHQDNNIFQDPVDIANAFSTAFSKPPNTNTANLTDNPSSINKGDSLPRVPRSFFMFPCTYVEVRSAILNMKNTSCGLDGINAFHMKEIVDYIAEPFAYIVNLIFKTGVFPDQLKQSKVIPIYKKGDKTLITNYRPISILPFFSKVVEKLIHQRLSNYLEKYGILTPRQFGFRPGYSTTLALIALTDKFKREIDNGKLVGSVFVDLTKAFDSIDHHILFEKLASYGITGPPLQLVRNYLLNRVLVVSVCGVISAKKIINIGVPQGSILGPLLFLVYINDLPSCLSTSTECLMYADDTTIYTSHKSIETVTTQLTRDLSCVNNWCHKNKLVINPSKTKYVVFRSRKQTDNLQPLHIDMQPIFPCNQCTFLGVQLDNLLKFNVHTTALRKKMAYGIRILVKARYYFRPHTLLTLYNAFIHSHLRYCIEAWGQTYQVHLDPVRHIQNQALRIITRSPYNAHVTPLYKELRIFPLDRLITYTVSIMAYRLFNNQNLLYIIGRRDLTNPNNTRFSEQNNFILPKIRTNYGKYTFEFAAIKQWNNLAFTIKTSRSLNSFKRLLRSTLYPV